MRCNNFLENEELCELFNKIGQDELKTHLDKINNKIEYILSFVSEDDRYTLFENLQSLLFLEEEKNLFVSSFRKHAWDGIKFYSKI